MTFACFYLGTHQPQWLRDARFARVPLFISHRRLTGRRRLPTAVGRWALDSGGFSELSMFGGWRTTAAEYVAAVARYDTEVGGLDWAAPQDWMCEPVMLAKTGLTVTEHQRRTVANYLDLTARWAEVDTAAESPFAPVVQGWSLPDYLRCADMYAAAGVDLRRAPVVGLGSVCRRQGTGEIAEIVAALAERDLLLHGFGMKAAGLRASWHLLLSADSMAWSYAARRSEPLPGCVGHSNCANCPRYALVWRDRVLSAADSPVQLRLGGVA